MHSKETTSWHPKQQFFLMDGNGETQIFHVKILNRLIETTIFEVDVSRSRIVFLVHPWSFF